MIDEAVLCELDRSMEIVSDQLDDWLLDGEFDKCSEFLRQAPVSKMPMVQMLTVLSATWEARIKLSDWTDFFGRVALEIFCLGESPDDILYGF